MANEKIVTDVALKRFIQLAKGDIEASKEAIDNIQVGGTNYCRGLGGTNYNLANFTENTYVSLEDIDGKTYVKTTAGATIRIKPIIVEPNTTYTWSFLVFGTHEADIDVREYGEMESGGMGYYNTKKYAIGTTPKRITHTFTTKSLTVSETLTIFFPNMEYNYYFADFQLEKGTKSSTYQPSYLDYTEVIEDLEGRTTTLDSQIATKATQSDIDAKVNHLIPRLDNIENPIVETSTLIDKVNEVDDNAGNIVEVSKIEGNTMQNIFSSESGYMYYSDKSANTSIEKTDNSVKVTINEPWTSAWAYVLLGSSNIVNLLKPSTKYTLIFDVETSYTISFNARLNTGGGGNPSSTLTESMSFPKGEGRFCKSLTTNSDLQNLGQAFYMGCTNNTTNAVAGDYFKVSNAMLLEGDWTNRTDIPDYFTGIESVNNPVKVKSIGKNLFNGNLTFGKGINSNTGVIENKTTGAISDYIEIDKNKSLLVSGLDNNLSNFCAFYDENKNFVTRSSGGQIATRNFKTTRLQNGKYLFETNAKYMIVYFYEVTNITTVSISNLDCSNLQIEYGTTATEYEPYKETNLQIPINEPLRSLPNGICDYIADGKIVRNVGKILLDESLNWYHFTTYVLEGFTTVYLANFGKSKTDDGSLLSDKFYVNGNVNIDAKEGFKKGGNDSTLFLMLDSTRLSSADLAGFKSWIKDNNITLYYHLDTPIIESIEYDPTLQTYQNGHILLGNSPIRPKVDVAYATHVTGRLNKAETELVENEMEIYDITNKIKGEQEFTERISDLNENDMNMRLLNLKGNTIQNLSFNDRNGILANDNSLYTIVNVNNGLGLTFSNDISALTYIYFRFSEGSITRMLKPSTTYTLVFNLEKPSTANLWFLKIASGDGAEVLTNVYRYTSASTSLQVCIPLTTVSDFNSFTKEHMIHIMPSNSEQVAGTTIKISNVMLLEGDWTGKEIPSYFTGIKSVNEEQTGLSVKSVGNNLLNLNKQELMIIGSSPSNGTYAIGSNNSVILHGNGNLYGVKFANNNLLLKNHTYTLSCKLSKDISSASIRLFYKDGTYSDNDTNVIKTSNGIERTLTIKKVTKDVKTISFYLGFPYTVSENVTIYDMKIEEGSTATEYEPYKESTITIPYTEPLRKLPNGTCDEVVNGKVIRRVGKYTFTGNEAWTQYKKSDGTTTNAYYVYTSNISNFKNVNSDEADSNLICNNFKSGTSNEAWALTTGIISSTRFGQLMIVSNGITTNENFKTWLQSNTTTVLYELKTPIEEDIPETILRGYKHFVFNNDVIPSSAKITFKNSLLERLKDILESLVDNSKSLTELCALVDELTLQIGSLSNE